MQRLWGKRRDIGDGWQRLVGVPAYDPAPEDILLTAKTVATETKAMAGSASSNYVTYESEVDDLVPVVVASAGASKDHRLAQLLMEEVEGWELKMGEVGGLSTQKR